MVAINYPDLRRQMKLDSPQRVCEFIREGLKEKWFRPHDFSLRQLAEYTIPDGHEWVRGLDPDYAGNSPVPFTEAAGGAVSTATFSNLTGQIVYSRIQEALTDPAFIGDQLITSIPTVFNGEKIPMIERMGDKATRVGEAEQYPLVGVSQRYFETPETVKRGFIVPVTKEAIFFDRTNQVLQKCSEVGYWAGVNREKEIIKVVTGTTNNFSMNGTTFTTYVTTGGHGIVNKQTQALVDWTDINETWLLFDAMTDWDASGEPVLVLPKTLLVPSALLATAQYVMNSTQVRGGTSNTTNFQTISTDPIKSIMPLQVLSSPIVKSVTSEDNDWWVGDFPRAFAFWENWGITSEQQSGGMTEAGFNRDIVNLYKVSWRGVAGVLDPHYAIQSTGGS